MGEREGIVVMHCGDDMGIAGWQLEMIQFADAVPHGGADDHGPIRI